MQVGESRTAVWGPLSPQLQQKKRGRRAWQKTSRMKLQGMRVVKTWRLSLIGWQMTMERMQIWSMIRGSLQKLEQSQTWP